MTLLVRFLTVCLLVAVGGCASLEVKRINSEEAKPNNVWVFFTVQDGDEPVAGLKAEDFAIYEDETIVSAYESKQVILNPDVAAVMYTLLLLDMSGSITEAGEASNVTAAARLFSERVGKTQKVGVYAFDGEEKIHSVVRFTEAEGSIEGGLAGLEQYHPKDPSTNLNGAVVQGLQELHTALAEDERPLKFGTLVVFTDGTDRAARVSREEMLEELGDSKYEHYEVFVIGVGAEIDEKSLQQVGRDGAELADDEEKVQAAFERVAARIESHAKRFYLLSYCTPAREGGHEVKIEARVPGKKEGKPKKKGALGYEFEADGFGPPPECDPNREPSFSLDDNLEGDADETEGAGDSKKSRTKKEPRGPGHQSRGPGESRKKSRGSAKTPKKTRAPARPPGGG